MCSLDILLEVKEVVGGHLEGFLCGKETFFSMQTIERMAKHFKVDPLYSKFSDPLFAHACFRICSRICAL